ncbi:serine/threonine-protein phosphatase 6 regulatory subunit 3 isoform X2 [Homalodisca vitripennis]|uniref:serine/threonine-protein phosphatase 6 regulatory subunit 3 isoform X2 n=2 Tax=Homalodisca vitripennis TaxID=197043 RepID=UPI001EEA06DE|nr:serine/threonine-protein phosphatase 6 regulatory subunit 3 isoform X2 [Homalodisca vitripennis]
MFWNYNQSSSPQIDNVFCKEDLTLQELLDQENILQELKSQNKKLIDFLIKPEVLSELVTLITTEPVEDIPQSERYKHPNIACELLTTDIPSLTENLARDPTLLSKLYSFLESEPPLNPLLASFFSRTMGVLVVRRSFQNWYSYQFTCLQVVEFLKSKQTSISLLLKHLGTSAIMDLALKLVTQIEGSDMKQNILNFMATQGLVENLVDLLSPSAGSGINSNAALLLCDIIVKSREAQLTCENKPEPDPILASLESGETIKKILEVILNGEKKESSLIGGISVLLTLLEPSKPIGAASLDSGGMNLNYGVDGGGGGASGDSPAPSPPPPVTLTTTEAIVPFLPVFHDLLLNPPQKPGVKLTCCTVDPPLGNTRLQIVKLLAALVSTHNHSVEEQLAALDTINVLLNLFFSYSWNNFLHTQVEKCLNAAIAVDPSPSDNPTDNLLIHNIFVKCQLLNKILEAWKENEEEQSKKGGFRKGYMGHLTRLSITINSHMEKIVKAQVPEDQLTAWQEFTSGPLARVKAQLETCLGGKHPAQSTSDDDERNFRNIPFQQDTQFQQIYTEYQTQQMASQFIEHFGYHESEFNDPEDNLNPSVDRLAHLSFSVTDDEELERQAEMFKQVCAQKVQSLDGEDDDDEIWSDHNVASSRVWNGGEEIANYNSSDDEERPGPEGREEAHMEIDQADPWNSGPVEGTADPWGGGTGGSNVVNEGWADFEANFGAASLPLENNVDVTVPPTELTTDTCSVPGMTAESRSEPLGASSSEVQADKCNKKDDNANLSLSSDEAKHLDEEQLIDNFRFLSSQGLIADQNDSSKVSTPVDSTIKPLDSPAGQKDTVETENTAVESTATSTPATQPETV